jgi:2-oxoglutarate ferredoxin oxidoreductase subunit alpha
MRQELDAELLVRLRSVRHYNGLPIDARSITDEIVAHEARTALPPETAPEDVFVGAEESV